MRRYIAPLIFGVGGVAILLSLCVWQVQRLSWKQAKLAEIESRIAAAPVPLADADLQEFFAVTATGTITDEEAHVLTSRKPDGAGFRVISVFETDGRRFLVDRGFVPEIDKNASRDPIEVTIVGNYRNVEESDSFTPEPDLAKNIHFARDVPVMAQVLNAEPVLIILRDTSEANSPVRIWPVDTAGIPNNHLNYAITWFLLAIVWAGMTAFLLWRIRQRTV